MGWIYLLCGGFFEVCATTALRYATGIGAAGTALLGLAYFSEPASSLRFIFHALLIGSILGLKLVSE
jgi:quaternary ammonium compound-resistance protein SugE